MKDFELTRFTPKDYMLLQNRFQDYTIIAGKKLANLIVVIAMKNQNEFAVVYTEDNFVTFNVHKYMCLEDAYPDYNNAYVLEKK